MSDLLLPFIGFAIVASVTPGPNNVLLTTSGLRFGFRRTVPHILGICVGFPLMVLIVGVGFAGLFAHSTLLHQSLKGVAAAYLAYLAIKIATAPPVVATGDTRSRPMRFVEAAAFQWVNPKAWIMAVGAATGYTTLHGNTVVEILVIAAIFFVIAFPASSFWAGFGTVLRRWLSNPRHIRAFNMTMAALLLASIVPIVVE